MLHTRQFKTAAALFLALAALNLSPTAVAEPNWTGKYLSTVTGTVVTYNVVTNTIAPTADPVDPYYCDESWTVSAGQLRCGVCHYIPAQAAWESELTQFAYGHCISMNTEPAGSEDVIVWRTDVRMHTSTSVRWVMDYGVYYLDSSMNTLSTMDLGETPCDAKETGAGWLHNCEGSVPMGRHFADDAPSGATFACMELLIWQGSYIEDYLMGCTDL